MTARDAFLAGDRPDDVAIYLAEDVLSGDVTTLAARGERLEDGVMLVVDGERGRALVDELLGVDAMAFAREAMQTDGDIAHDLTGGTCPAADGGDHDLSVLLSFVEPAHEDVGGRYADGPVVHAYAACSCGQSYADHWTVDTD
ncbi:MAG: DUF5807 family protein [Halobacteriaceae archaeon]